MAALGDREITLEAVRAGVSMFAASYGVDASDAGLASEADGEVDLSLVERRRALHRWLNAWGCRIRYARPGEPDLFDAGLAAWWGRRRGDLATVTGPLSDLSDDQITCLSVAFEDLSSLPIARTVAGTDRTMGPTAAGQGAVRAPTAGGHAVGPDDRRAAPRRSGRRSPSAPTCASAGTGPGSCCVTPAGTSRGWPPSSGSRAPASPGCSTSTATSASRSEREHRYGVTVTL